MRKYRAAWMKLRKEGKLALKVHPALVSRFKKAIIKEKDADVGFKLLNPVDTPRLVIEYEEEKQKLSFRLVQKYGLEEIVR